MPVTTPVTREVPGEVFGARRVMAENGLEVSYALARLGRMPH